ncbi:MAG: hypothetical protein GY737_05690 [Desulfobacteraceae bacterium]|nr:hypothetical protein [Desulfobacteraceae bacterium]
MNRLLRKIDATGNTDRRRGSGRLRTARNLENVDTVREMLSSQEGQEGMHRTPRQISRETGISHSTVRRIAKHDLNKQNSTVRRIREEWDNLSQRFINRKIDEFRVRLQEVVDADGGHIENLHV